MRLPRVGPVGAERPVVLAADVVLEPGDVINTGTPAGVAFGANDVPCLRAGDVVEAGIDGQRHVPGQA